MLKDVMQHVAHPFYSLSAFSELFAYGGDLTGMAADPEITTSGNVRKAQENARLFAEAVHDRLK